MASLVPIFDIFDIFVLLFFLAAFLVFRGLPEKKGASLPPELTIASFNWQLIWHLKGVSLALIVYHGKVTP
jgi:hypothetical protein